MKSIIISALTVAMLSTSAGFAQGQSLLGGVVGSSGDNALVTIGSGDAGSSGVVNLGLGGSDQIVDAQVGSGSGIAGATVGSGNGSALDANVDILGGTATVDATVGGDNLVDLNVGIGGRGNGSGTPGNGGNNGGNPSNGNNGSRSGSGITSLAAVSCEGVSGRQLQQIIRATRLDGSWQRASDVNIQRVQVCPALRTQLSAALQSSGLGPQLHSAVASDALLSASLTRSNYGPEQVFAVRRNGNQLTVFVY